MNREEPVTIKHTRQIRGDNITWRSEYRIRNSPTRNDSNAVSQPLHKTSGRQFDHRRTPLPLHNNRGLPKYSRHHLQQRCQNPRVIRCPPNSRTHPRAVLPPNTRIGSQQPKQVRQIRSQLLRKHNRTTGRTPCGRIQPNSLTCPNVLPVIHLENIARLHILCLNPLLRSIRNQLSPTRTMPSPRFGTRHQNPVIWSTNH